MMERPKAMDVALAPIQNNGTGLATGPKQWAGSGYWSETMDHLQGLRFHIYKYEVAQMNNYIWKNKQGELHFFVCLVT
jgi:hypothetical protein